MSHHASQPFEPYIPDNTKLPEFTLRAVVTGALLGMVFGASSLYLVLKVGLTVSASIPVAVISLAIFRTLSKLGVRDSSILENNITQTAGSAGESIAFGVGVTMPAIFILGFDFELTRVMLVAVLGSLLGILMMIPLRRTHIVEDHGILKYPEGTACAAVLKAGANDEDRAAASPAAKEEMKKAQAAGLGKSLGAKQIFVGFGIGLAYKTLYSALKCWVDTPQKIFSKPLAGGSIAIEGSPELLGVGYIIGPRIAGIMCAGGALSYLVLIPLIKFFGDGIGTPIAPGTIPIGQMALEGSGSIRDSYILYIGAGAVAAGGVISMIQALPAIWRGLKASFKDMRPVQKNSAADKTAPDGVIARTARDIPMKYVLIGIVVLMTIITLAPSLHMNILGAILVIIFGFLFVTVSSRLTGEIGSTSNPTSGMTVATLLFTCLIFLIVGWTGNAYYVTALSIGAIVCIAAANGGTTSQDLKTGFLVGGTPRYQQYAILVGALCSALVLGWILNMLNDRGTVYVPVKEVAPAGLHVDVSTLSNQEKLRGPQARSDANAYYTWHKTDAVGGREGKYLVNAQGDAVWYVDPAINGSFKHRPDGSDVSNNKFDAPKAVLMSYIIRGVLDHKLPWALVLIGVMITVTLQLSFVPALAFAVGVYLPISSTTPIFVGGLLRWGIDKYFRKKPAYANLTPEEFNAEADKSPGVLLASGYIAGGAIAGILIAILLGGFYDLSDAIEKFSAAHNPFYGGEYAGLLSLIPFTILAVFLYGTAREWFLAPKRK